MIDAEHDNPGMAEAIAERNELTRVAAQNALESHRLGYQVCPLYLQWCRDFVAQVKPLRRSLTTGEPA